VIRHVVLWRLTPEGLGRFADIEAALRSQLGRIPGLQRIEVGRNFAQGRRTVDFALICDFEDREARRLPPPSGAPADPRRRRPARRRALDRRL